MKKPTKAVSLQIPLLTMEYIEHTVCRKGLLSIPRRKKKKCSHSLGLTRGKDIEGLDNICY